MGSPWLILNTSKFSQFDQLLARSQSSYRSIFLHPSDSTAGYPLADSTLLHSSFTPLICALLGSSLCPLLPANACRTPVDSNLFHNSVTSEYCGTRPNYCLHLPSTSPALSLPSLAALDRSSNMSSRASYLW